ncbi:MAG: hypothetical protein LQ352_005459 [Teloschistes flavicans]|nr:MAG: hypothetical protein LQ352_005459 [Teloschistes flavicans]
MSAPDLNSPPPLDDKTIILAHQLIAYGSTLSRRELDKAPAWNADDRHVLAYVYKYYQLPQAPSVSSTLTGTRSGRTTATSQAAGLPKWSTTWTGVNSSAYKSAIHQFVFDTTEFKRAPQVITFITTRLESEAAESRSNNPIGGSSSNDNIAGDDIIDERTQRLLDRAVDAALARYAAAHPPQRGHTGPAGPPGPPGPSGQHGQSGAASSSSSDNNRWHAADVGFFDPMYDSKSAVISLRRTGPMRTGSSNLS